MNNTFKKMRHTDVQTEASEVRVTEHPNERVNPLLLTTSSPTTLVADSRQPEFADTVLLSIHTTLTEVFETPPVGSHDDTVDDIKTFPAIIDYNVRLQLGILPDSKITCTKSLKDFEKTVTSILF